MTPIIKAANITKNYGQQEVLKGIDLLIAPGDFTCIMGRSGCGKTTLLKILGLMHPPTTGDVFFEEYLLMNFFQMKFLTFAEERLASFFRISI